MLYTEKEEEGSATLIFVQHDGQNLFHSISCSDFYPLVLYQYPHTPRPRIVLGLIFLPLHSCNPPSLPFRNSTASEMIDSKQKQSGAV